jgi:predicted dehydrogenase
MRILIGEEWTDGFLDEHRGDGGIRIDVRAIATCKPVDGLFFERERSLRRLWNTVREVGIVWLFRKVASRWKERSRNKKFLSIGLGVVRDADAGSPVRRGDAVVFIAPAHPRAMDRIVIAPSLTAVLPGGLPDTLPAEAIVLSDALRDVAGPWADAEAFSPFSGDAVDPAHAERRLRAAGESLRKIDWRAGRRLPVEGGSAVRERDDAGAAPKRLSAVLFGYGHYGRSVVIPNVRHKLVLAAVHEIDATLLAERPGDGIRRDTSATPRDDERYDVYLIASFHHTHVPLAVHALSQGAACVVEKPIATTREQLADLLGALEGTKGRLFAGFHKRYSPLNVLARQDLARHGAGPVHYHAIVFEEPLPPHHWYRWPRSKSRIVSNGCHWLDHFLFLNDWAQPTSWSVSRGGPDREIANVSVTLDNGAFFSMLLTDAGSPRIGVRDYIELRSGRVTVTVDNGSRYVAEDDRRILRRARVNKVTSYESMYRTIAGLIADGAPGDSIRSVQVSSELVLAVEEAFEGSGAAG